MPSTPAYTKSGIPYITSKNIKNGQIDFNNINYISKTDYDEISKNRSILINDLLITMIGTIGECAFVEKDIDFYGQNMFLVRLDELKINKKYFYYYFIMSKDKLISKKNTSSQGYLKSGNIESLKIPVPPLEVQEEIVNILDKFEEYINSIESGLRGEIEARHQQYEYYRDKLLTFNRKEV